MGTSWFEPLNRAIIGMGLHGIENVSHDLESFAKHAGRSTINTSDVLLLARRNEGLEDVLKQEAKNLKACDKA
jgi:hypothetical protein